MKCSLLKLQLVIYNVIAIRVGRRKAAHHTKRNRLVLKAYRAGHPRRHIAKKVQLSERQISNIISNLSTTRKQRQQWYDEHEENAVKYRTKRQHSQHRFRP